MSEAHRGYRAPALLVVLALVFSAPVQPAVPGVDTPAKPARFFAPDDPINSMISGRAIVDPNSRTMMSAIAVDGAHANLVEFGIPINTADNSTPHHVVQCDDSPSWGVCPLGGVSVPIPNQAWVQTGSDRAMVVVDAENDVVYEFWRATKTPESWTTQWGALSVLSGSAWTSSATGAGLSRLAGVIRLSELQSGVIPHALALQSSNTCAGVWRSPATKTDGKSMSADCIPEGSRLQLDPTIDVNAIKDLTPAERAVGIALQNYGGYVIDTGGAKLSVSFELAPDADGNDPGALYLSMGLDWDYALLDQIPWEHVRVLSNWKGME